MNELKDKDEETYEERLLNDSNLFASQCVHGFMMGSDAMVKAPYPILPIPAYSWAHAAHYICSKLHCTLIPTKIAKLLMNIPLRRSKENQTRYIVAKEIRETLPTCIKQYDSFNHTQPCNKGAFITITFPPPYNIIET